MSPYTPIFSDAKWPLFPFLYFSFPDLPKMKLLKEVDESTMTHLRNSQCQIEANAKIYTVRKESKVLRSLLWHFTVLTRQQDLAGMAVKPVLCS